MIGIYDYSVELDDPRPMNHSNIISIFTYMLHRTESEIDNSFSMVVNPDFLTAICGAYDKELRLVDGIPQLEVDWGEYKAIFTSRIDTDGIEVALFYKQRRKRPSLDVTSETMNHLDENDNHFDNESGNTWYDYCLFHKEDVKEPFYVSPYEPHYWYQKYTYGMPYGFGHMGYFKPNPHQRVEEFHKDGKVFYMIEIDTPDIETDEDGMLPSSTPMDLIWTEVLLHDTLVKDIEIYQQ